MYFPRIAGCRQMACEMQLTLGYRRACTVGTVGSIPYVGISTTPAFPFTRIHLTHPTKPQHSLLITQHPTWRLSKISIPRKASPRSIASCVDQPMAKPEGKKQQWMICTGSLVPKPCPTLGLTFLGASLPFPGARPTPSPVCIKVETIQHFPRLDWVDGRMRTERVRGVTT